MSMSSQYIAILYQERGCQHPAAECAIDTEFIQAESWDEAMEEARKFALRLSKHGDSPEDYNPDCDKDKRELVHLIEIGRIEDGPLEKWYGDAAILFAERDVIKSNKRDQEEYARLKLQFGEAEAARRWSKRQ